MQKNPFEYSNFKKLISLELIKIDSELSIDYFSVENIKGEVKIAALSETDLLSNKSPIVINISIKEIISKQFESANDENLFLSNLNFEEFYIQKFPVENLKVYNFIRKEKLNDILNKLEIDKSKIIAINLAGSIFLKFINRMSIPESQLILGPHSYKLSSNRWLYSFTENHYGDDEISIFGDQVSERQIISFLSAAILIRDSKNYGFLNLNQVNDNFLRSIYLCNSNRAFKVMVLAFLVLFTTYYSIFSFLENRKYLLAESQKELIVNISLRDKLKKENEQLGALMSQKSNYNTIPGSYILDRIALSKSSNVKFTRLRVFPELTRSEKNSPQTYDLRKIIVEGHSQSNSEMNNWSNELNHFQFLESVAIHNINGKRDESIEFEIELNLFKK